MGAAFCTFIIASCLALTSTAAFAASDSEFIAKAMQGDNSETRLGGLAEQRAASTGVRDFGRMLREDHTKGKQEATSVAQHLGVPPTDAMAPEAVKEERKLEKLSGPAFDREFTSYMVKDHKKDIADFKQEASRGKDESTRALARRTIPVLQKHLDTASQLRRSL